MRKIRFFEFADLSVDCINEEFIAFQGKKPSWPMI